jgi:hypothetical protein
LEGGLAGKPPEVAHSVVNKRLLLVLFALGTNMGIRQMAVTGEHGAAVTGVVNATLEARPG